VGVGGLAMFGVGGRLIGFFSGTEPEPRNMNENVGSGKKSSFGVVQGTKPGNYQASIALGSLFKARSCT
jgi:hypothetical protein